jgi:hypothetical protein
MDLSDFRIRPATSADADRLAELFRSVYRESSHPGADARRIREGMAAGQTWIVGTCGEDIAACTALIPCAWNDTYESGRSVTHPDFRRTGLGREIYRRAIVSALQRPDCDLVVGYPRSAVMCRMVAETQPSMGLFGHDGGANVALGRREYHALGLIGRAREVVRVPPPASPGNHPPVTALATWLGFREEAGPYPPDVIVGPPGPCRFASDRGRLDYDVMATSLGLSVHLTAAQAGPGGLDRLVARWLAGIPGVAHAGCYVLADKGRVVTRLGRLGFRATAYLPGWFKWDGRRYDCYYLARRSFVGEPVCNGMDEMIAAFDAALVAAD